MWPWSLKTPRLRTGRCPRAVGRRPLHYRLPADWAQVKLPTEPAVHQHGHKQVQHDHRRLILVSERRGHGRTQAGTKEMLGYVHAIIIRHENNCAVAVRTPQALRPYRGVGGASIAKFDDERVGVHAFVRVKHGGAAGTDVDVAARHVKARATHNEGVRILVNGAARQLHQGDRGRRGRVGEISQ